MNSERNKETNNETMPKSDILRAEDIIPGNSVLNTDAGQTKGSIAKELMQARQRSPQTAQNNAETVKEKVPKFDLAEEIMAEQRKIISTKRKRPGQKTSRQQPAKLAPEHEPQPSADARKQRQIIAAIVARDIEKLCDGKSE